MINLIFLLFSISAFSQEPVLVFDYKIKNGNHDRIERPNSSNPMESDARNAKRQIRQNEAMRNAYIPNQVKDMISGPEQVASLMSENALNFRKFYEEMRNLNKDFKISNDPRLLSWDTYKIYDLTQEQADESIDSYFTALKRSDYNSAIQIAEQLFYSNRNIGDLKGFNQAGIFVPEDVDSSIPASPFSEVSVSTPKNTAHGQILRSVMNEYQIEWANGQDVLLSPNKADLSSQFMIGLTFARMADVEYQASPSRADGYLHLSKIILDSFRGFKDGFRDNIQQTIELLPFMAKAINNYKNAVLNDPQYLVQSTWGLIQASPKLAVNIASHVKKYLEEQKNIIVSGSAYERSKLIGDLVADELTSLVTARITKGGKLLIKEASKEASQSWKALAKIGAVATEDTDVVMAIAGAVETGLQSEALVKKIAPGVDASKHEILSEIHQSLMMSESDILKNEASEITKKIAQYNGQELDVLYRVATSQMDPKNRARYFNSVSDIEKIVASSRVMQNIVKNETGKTVEMYVARVKEKVFIDSSGTRHVNTQESLRHLHSGSKSSTSRSGVGGPNGVETLSFGAGQTAQEAKEIALAEFRSYGSKIPEAELVMLVEKIKADNILFLDKTSQLKYNILSSDLGNSRKILNAYLAPNALGVIAKSKFSGVYLPSAEFEGGMVLHMFGDLK